ncbi:Organic cation transporter protein [Trichuris trichiura]|uniref:Organic cation transporter protein n=1 Tax=Trichuris trichiura TaxID=36087 RepID=A0A077Z6D0_TRITR|nr:Organic cation transporter protein [Trichuris trichiura]
MTFDDILCEHVGEFGRYQKLQYLLVNLPVIITSMHVLSWTFTSEVLQHRCIYPGENSTSTFYIPSNWSSSLIDSSGSSCQRYKGVSYWDQRLPDNATLQSCVDGYRWNPTSFARTAVTEWDLVCDKKWVRSFVQSVYYIGQFFGSYICGRLSDRFGRKMVFFVAIILQLTCGILIAVAPYWPLVALLRIGLGFAHPGIFVIAVVIGTELVGPKQRVLAGVGAGIFFSFGQIFLGSLAYLFDRYDYLQLAISLPAFLFFSYYWLVPESARWLMVNKRFDEAIAILRKAAKFNGRTLPNDVADMIELQPQSNTERQSRNKPSAADLFRRPVLRRRSLIIFYVWIAVACVYYALSINPSFLGGSINESFIIGGFLEMPCLFVILLTINRFGRRLLLMVGFLLCTFLIFLTVPISNDQQVVKMILVLLAKSVLSAVYAVIYIYTSELFPTVIRNTAMGLCSMIARVGAIAASYFALWLAEDYAILVSILYGSIALVAGVFVFFLPETAGKALAETIEDAERLKDHFPKRCRQAVSDKEMDTMDK